MRAAEAQYWTNMPQGRKRGGSSVVYRGLFVIGWFYLIYRRIV